MQWNTLHVQIRRPARGRSCRNVSDAITFAFLISNAHSVHGHNIENINQPAFKILIMRIQYAKYATLQSGCFFHICFDSYKSHVNITDTHWHFISRRLETASKFDILFQIMTSSSYLTKTFRKMGDFYPCKQINRCPRIIITVTLWCCSRHDQKWHSFFI